MGFDVQDLFVQVAVVIHLKSTLPRQIHDQWLRLFILSRSWSANGGKCRTSGGRASERKEDSFGLLPMAARYSLAQWAHLRWTRMLLGRGGGQPIAPRRFRFSAGPRLLQPHERSCSRGF